MDRENVRTFVNQYCLLRRVQFAAYELYARKYSLTAKELLVPDTISHILPAPKIPAFFCCISIHSIL